MKKGFFALSLFVFSITAWAEEGHLLSNISGTNIDLKTYDHAFAGTIKDYVAWGVVDENTFTSELVVRKYGQTIKTTFKRQEDGRIGGVISSSCDTGDRSTSIFVNGANPNNDELYLLINGERVVVKIEYDDFVDNHFVNPKYTAMIEGKEVYFKLESGQACFGLSFHLSMLIFGAYIH